MSSSNLLDAIRIKLGYGPNVKPSDFTQRDWVKIINLSDKHALWAAKRKKLPPKILEILASLDSDEISTLLLCKDGLPRECLDRLSYSASPEIQIKARIKLGQKFGLAELQEIASKLGEDFVKWQLPFTVDLFSASFDEDGRRWIVALRKAERKETISRMQRALNGELDLARAKPIMDLIAKAIAKPIWIAPTLAELGKEIDENTCIIPISAEEQFSLGRTYFNHAFNKIILAAKASLRSSKIDTSLIFYCWDDMGSLAWNVIRSGHPSLPFASKIKRVSLEEFLDSYTSKKPLEDSIAAQEKYIRMDEGNQSNERDDEGHLDHKDAHLTLVGEFLISNDQERINK